MKVVCSLMFSCVASLLTFVFCAAPPGSSKFDDRAPNALIGPVGRDPALKVGKAPPVLTSAVKRVNVAGLGVNTDTKGGLNRGVEDGWHDEVSMCLEVLERELFKVYAPNFCKRLVGEDATRVECLQLLDAVANASAEGDLTVLYFGVHGDYDRSKGGFLFSFYGGDVCAKQLGQLLSLIKGTLIVFVDACHAGGFLRERFAHPDSVIVPVCRHDQSAYCWQFARPLAMGLTGSADADGDGKVTLGELVAYCKTQLADRMKPQTVVDVEVKASPRRDLVLARR